MDFKCPQCQRVPYDRRRKQCGFCGAELPPESLFTPAEIQAMDQREVKAREERRRQRDKDASEEEKRQKEILGDLLPPGFL